MSAIDDSVTVIAVVVLVVIYVVANEFLSAVWLVTISVVVIVVAGERHTHVAIIAGVIAVRILMAGVIGIFSALSFLAADITECVFILVDVIEAGQFLLTSIALPILVGICANV